MNVLKHRCGINLLPLTLGFMVLSANCQTPTNPPSGQVIFSTEHPPATPQATESSSQPIDAQTAPDVLPKVEITNAERTAVAISAYKLDLHMIPAESREEVHATITLRNTSGAPLARIPLQLSSTLRWQTITAAAGKSLEPVRFTQSPIATDTDHTGYAQEAILSPARPLAPGGTLTLSVFYSGEIRQSAARIELLGTPHSKAAATDWDAILPVSDTASTALRGFGNVLWYPVAAPAATLGQGNELFDAVARQRLLGATATISLHLTVEYAGDPPNAAIFNGRLQPLVRTPDLNDQVVAETHGLATADYAAAPLGFRTPTLFLTAQEPIPAAGPLLSVITANSDSITPYATAASTLEPLLGKWLGPSPAGPLTLLDHPGEAFEDAALIAAHLSPTATPEGIAPEIIGGLTHGWFHVGAPTSVWLDQGFPEFMGLMLVENRQGREAAIAELQHASILIALAEPDLTQAHPELQPLTHAYADVFLRLKAASVLWQLRDLLGEDVFRQSVAAFRRDLQANPALDQDQTAFQKTLERVSKRELDWLFEDWVYRDRGLPDLTVVQINPRVLPSRPGKNSGYLVAVEVRNDGDAVADVPVTVRSGTLTSTERLRIPAHSSGSTRILFEGTPDTLQVNDGSVPELRTTVHTQHIELPATPTIP